MVTDRNYNLLYAFPEALKLLNIKDTTCHYNLKDFIPDINMFQTPIKNTIAGIKPINGVIIPVILTILETEEKCYLIKLSPARNCEPAIDEIKEKYEQLKKEQKNRSVFLASLSHDLKNPLQSLIGFSQALTEGLGGNLNDKQMKFASIIYRNANSLLRMIINQVDYSKIEAGIIDFNREPVDLRDLIKASLNILQPVLEQKELKISVNIDNLKNNIIHIDSDKFKQIIISLLENSIKYSINGLITLDVSHPSIEIIKAHLETENDLIKTENFIIITIKDDGKGISEESKDNIFDEHTPAGDKISRKYGISGLNMVIAHKFILKMGGAIWLEEDLSSGVTINIILPVD